jgi:predicted transcriptional regulator
MPTTQAQPDTPILLPPVLTDRLRSVAAAEHLPVEAVVSAAIADYLQRRSRGHVGELGMVFATSHAVALSRLAS